MRPLLWCLALGMLSCAADAEGVDDAARRTSAAIIKGVTSPDAEDSVVAIAIRSHGYVMGLCTGTLVAPNLVLTARHCVANTDTSALCRADGSAISAAVVHADRSPTDLDVYSGGAALQTIYSDGDRTRAAARGKALVVEGSTLCNGDLAFLVLDRPLSGPCAPIRTTATAVGASLTAVGYGLTESGAVPSSRQTRSGILVRAAGPVTYTGGAGLGDAELLVGESSCNGDSGGPLLSSGGAVVGVTSRGGGGDGPDGNDAASCVGANAHSIYTHLATKPTLVARAYAAAGAEIWREGDRSPYPWTSGLDPSPPASLAVNDGGAPSDAASDAAHSDAVAPSGHVPDDEITTSRAAPVDPSTAPRPLSCAASQGGPPPAAGIVALFLGLAMWGRRRRRPSDVR